MSYAQVLNRWATDEHFADFFSQLLASSRFEAYFFETPALTKTSVEQPFEFVLINSTTLARVQASPYFYQAYFDRATTSIVSFSNLGGDAILVVPCPTISYPKHFTHLAKFIRLATDKQKQAFWQNAAMSIQKRLSDKPVWLSTSGLGVYWLHLRLDDRPKYYQHKPYKRS